MNYFFVWTGIMERGDLEKLYFAPLIGSDPLMRAGVVYSTAEARVPPLRTEFLLQCLDEAFDENSCAVLMSDSASAYVNLKGGERSIVEEHHVNHSATPRENTRSVEVLADVQSQQKRPGTAGTQMVDGCWRKMDIHIQRR